MKSNRRDMLKIFGVTAAAIPVVDSKDLSEGPGRVEKIEDSTVENLSRNWWQPVFDVQRGRLYSALQLEPKDYIFYEGPEHGEGALKDRHRFFHYGIGLGNPYVTPWCRTGTVGISETNMYQAQRLDAPESFMVERAGLIISPSVHREVLNQFVDNYAFTFWMGHKYYFRCPVAEIFKQTASIDSLDTVSLKGLVELQPLPLIIASQMSFYAEVDGTPFTWSQDKGALRMWAVLEGRHARGVQ